MVAGIVYKVFHEPPEAKITVVHVWTGWNPEHSLPGLKGKHSASKDSVQPVHDNVCLVWLCFILLPDGLVELGLAHLLLDLGEQEMKIENVYFDS